MFKVLSLLTALLMLSACNDLDGKLTVFTDFMLVDEHGREIMIPAGTYEAELDYDVSDGDIELEIESIDRGRDRDFDFQVPDLSQEDFQQERLELHFPATQGDRELDTRILITNLIIAKTGPVGTYYRCREHGSAVYSYRPVVFYRLDRRMHAAIHIGSAEETLALFEASERIKDRQIVWKGQCGDEMPENYNDVVNN